MTIKSSWLFDECGNSIHYVSFSPVFGRTVDVFSGCGELASHNRVSLHSPAHIKYLKDSYPSNCRYQCVKDQ